MLLNKAGIEAAGISGVFRGLLCVMAAFHVRAFASPTAERRPLGVSYVNAGIDFKNNIHELSVSAKGKYTPCVCSWDLSWVLRDTLSRNN